MNESKVSAMYKGKAGDFSYARLERISQDIDMGRQISTIDAAWMLQQLKDAAEGREDANRKLYITSQIIDHARLSLEAVMEHKTPDSIDIDIALQDGTPMALDGTIATQGTPDNPETPTKEGIIA